MAHNCEAVLITCMDFRLHQRKDGRNYIAEFIRTLGVDCDLITRAGGVKDLIREPKFLNSLKRDFAVSTSLHAVKKIILLNHEDCGAYPLFSNANIEFLHHLADLQFAKQILEKAYPQKEILIYLARLEFGRGSDVFKIREV